MKYLDNNKEYEIAELLCAKCLNRWIGIYPVEWRLLDIVCNKCEEGGHVIKTGQKLHGIDVKKFEHDEQYQTMTKRWSSGKHEWEDYKSFILIQ